MGRELATVGPADHHVEFDLAMVLAGHAGATHCGDDTAGSDAVPDQVQMCGGGQSFANQHPVERGTHRDLMVVRVDRNDGPDAEAQVQVVRLRSRPGPVADTCQQSDRERTRRRAQQGKEYLDELQVGFGHRTRLRDPAGYRTQYCGAPYPGQMSTSPQAMPLAGAPGPDGRRPRRAVIDQAWRAIGPGVEVLSGDDGGPLSRTVKRILDPLVLRLRANPQFSAPVLDPAVAAALYDLIVDYAHHLRCAAAWFAVLKLERRRLRITTGNAQELYFPVCFELAVTAGAPTQPGQRTAETVLREIHQDRDRTAIEVLNRYVADPRVIAGLARQRDRSWRDVQPDDGITGPFLAGLATVLGSADGHRDEVARQRVWSALIADATPFNLGARARHSGQELPWSIVDVGLSSVAPQRPPPIRTEALGDRPLDRTVIDRVRATLRRALDRDELPDMPALCAEEVDRACAPWGLLVEDKQATLVAGIALAGELNPLAERTVTAAYALAGQIQARLRKEAYVLHARRYLAEGAAVHPRQQQVIDELTAFVRPYVSRLWARLHGRDVWQEPCDDVDDVRAVLEGVARSVSLDHRGRIKAMLETQGLG